MYQVTVKLQGHLILTAEVKNMISAYWAIEIIKIEVEKKNRDRMFMYEAKVLV